LQLVKKFPAFLEPEGSSPYSQVPATCPYPEPTPIVSSYQKEILHKVQLRESLCTPERRSVSDNDDNGSSSCEWEPLNKMAPGESNSIIAAKWLDSGVSNEAWRRTNLLPPQQFLNELLTIWLIDIDCTSFLLSARTGMSEHFLRHSLTRSDLYWILVLRTGTTVMPSTQMPPTNYVKISSSVVLIPCSVYHLYMVYQNPQTTVLAKSSFSYNTTSLLILCVFDTIPTVNSD